MDYESDEDENDENDDTANVACPWKEEFEIMLIGKATGTKRKYTSHFIFIINMMKELGVYTLEPKQLNTKHLKQIAVAARDRSSSSTVGRDIIGFLIVFWEFLRQQEKVTIDTSLILKSLKPKKQAQKGKERTLTRQECKNMYNIAQSMSGFHEAVFACLYFAGMRRFELAKLQVSECVIQNHVLTHLTFIGKGNKKRTVPLNKNVAKALKPFVIEAKKRSNKWLFPGKNGHICEDVIYKVVVALGNFSGISKKHECNITPHWLRHAFATHAGQLGGDLKTISEQMGHGNIATTSDYMHSNKEKGASSYLEFEEEDVENVENEDVNQRKRARKEAKKKYKNLKKRKMNGEEIDDDDILLAKRAYKNVKM